MADELLHANAWHRFICEKSINALVKAQVLNEKEAAPHKGRLKFYKRRISADAYLPSRGAKRSRSPVFRLALRVGFSRTERKTPPRAGRLNNGSVRLTRRACMSPGPWISRRPSKPARMTALLGRSATDDFAGLASSSPLGALSEWPIFRSSRSARRILHVRFLPASACSSGLLDLLVADLTGMVQEPFRARLIFHEPAEVAILRDMALHDHAGR